MYKSNSGLGIYSNRFCIKLSILLTESKCVLIRYYSYIKTLAAIMKNLILISIPLLIFNSCISKSEKKTIHIENKTQTISISKDKYQNQLYGFWLGQCIANWTGLVTEMDKIGNIGEIKTGDFYTRDDWGKPDQPSIWSEGVPSDLSSTIDFVFKNSDEICLLI